MSDSAAEFLRMAEAAGHGSHSRWQGDPNLWQQQFASEMKAIMDTAKDAQAEIEQVRVEARHGLISLTLDGAGALVAFRIARSGDAEAMNKDIAEALGQAQRQVRSQVADIWQRYGMTGESR